MISIFRKETAQDNSKTVVSNLFFLRKTLVTFQLLDIVQKSSFFGGEGGGQSFLRSNVTLNAKFE